MNDIDRVFKSLKAKKETAFIAYITAGYPDLKTTNELVIELDKSGVDIIELGVPFSDPVADGPVIQAASEKALKAGVNLKAVLSLVSGVRAKIRAPIVLMTYYNIIHAHGIERFIAEAGASGVSGLIVADMPFEESGELVSLARKNEFSVILLAAPTTTNERFDRIAERSSGFIYYVSLTGVTGVRADIASDLGQKIKAFKRKTRKPICVGFGVSTPAQARNVANSGADGVIVGSAIIKEIDRTMGAKDPVRSVGAFTRKLVDAVKSAR